MEGSGQNGHRAAKEGPQVRSAILLVAGPSGSGKTTFLKMLREKSLPHSVASLLPAGSEAWEQYGHRRRDTPEGRGPFALHYTIIYPRLAGTTFADDPALSPLREAGSATVVTIHLDAMQAIRQLEGRRAEHAVARGRVRTLIRRLRRRLGAGEKRDIVELYRRPDWLASCYRDWDRYVEALSGLGKLQLVDVAPTVGPAGEARAFRLLARARTGA